MTKKKIPWIILCLLIIHGINHQIFNFVDNQFSTENEDTSLKDEWDIVANRILIHRNNIFYMFNDSLLIFNIFIDESCLKRVSIKINFPNSSIYLPNNKLSFFRLYDYRKKNCLFQVRTKFSVNSVNEMYLHVYYISYSSRPLNVSVKIKSKLRNSVFICTRLYNKNLDYEQLKSWIKISKKQKYSRIILSNYSMLNDERFHGLLKTHKNFVELRRYNYIPYFNPNTSTVELYNYNDGLYKGLYFEGIQYSHERNSINECYLDNVYNADFIAIMDIDELLLSNSENKKFNCETSDIYTFMKDLRWSIGKSASYWFSYKLFISHKFERVIISALNSSLFNKTKFTDEMRILTEKFPGTEKQTEILIKSKESFDYARNLLKTYEEKLISRQELLNPYGFLFSLQNEYQQQYGWGKSVHETDDIIAFGQHEAFGTYRRTNVNYTYGFIGHFRLIANHLPKSMSVTSFQMGSNFHSCF